MCNNNNEEEYYQSMQENLNDMEEALDNGVATDADIEDFVNRMTIQTYDFNYCLDLPLYRARFDNGFDNTDPHQFGYIHNLAAITRYRYNKAQEAVLYMATEPSTAYKEIENVAKDKLLSMLPDELKETYRSAFYDSSEEAKRVKWADKISAYIKCVEEKKAGNREFVRASESIYEALGKIDAPEVNYFINTFLESYALTLDEQE